MSQRTQIDVFTIKAAIHLAVEDQQRVACRFNSRNVEPTISIDIIDHDLVCVNERPFKSRRCQYAVELVFRRNTYIVKRDR